MRKEYENIREFCDDCHENLSIKEIIISMGIVESKDFHGDFLRCIFHDGDNTPSLQVKEGFFKCYACGLKGDIFKFLELKYKLNFYEAVKYLADFLNIKIKDMKYQYDNKMSELANEWNQYIKNMDLLDQKDSLTFRKEYFPETIGYDNKEEYIVFPITSKTGSVLGFTKRRIDKYHELKNLKRDDKFIYPKWKHSTLNNSLIGLCHNIFNLQNAFSEMKNKDEVIITEGPKDVIAYERIGLQNTICTCGTNNINNVFDVIMPIKNIILSMDNDEAGIKSTCNTILYLAGFFDIKNIKVNVLPEGKDPYDITSKELKEVYNNKIEGTRFYIRTFINEPFKIKELYDEINENTNYNYLYFMKILCEEKNLSVTNAENWLINSCLNKNNSNNDNKNINKLSEEEMLLAIVECRDINIPLFISPEKAKKILKLKYGWKEENNGNNNKNDVN